MRKITTITYYFLAVIAFLATTDSADGMTCEAVYQMVEDACPTEPTHPNYPEGGWTNHGDYVSCVVLTLQPLHKSGEVTQECRQAIVTEASDSDIGKTYVQCPCESFSKIDDHIEAFEIPACADRRNDPSSSVVLFAQRANRMFFIISASQQDDMIKCIFQDATYGIYDNLYITIEELQVCQDMILQSKMWSLNGCPNAP